MFSNLSVSSAVRHWARFEPDRPAAWAGARLWSYRELADAADAVSRSPGFAAAVQRDEPTQVITGGHELKWLAGVVAVLDAGGALAFREDAEGLQLDSRDRIRLLDLRSENLDHLSTDWTVTSPTRRLSDLWGVFRSSGTSGTATLAARNDFSMLSEIFGWTVELGLLQGDKVALHHPLHYAGTVTMIATALTVGAGVGICGASSEARKASLRSADVVVTGPCLLRRCLTTPPRLGRSMHQPRILIITGEPVDAGTIEHCHRALPHTRIMIAWGTAEGLGTVADVTSGLCGSGYVGRPFVSESIFAIGRDGARLPPNTLGRIAGLVDSNSTPWPPRGPASSGGPLVSGDIGYVDDDQRVYVLGRISEEDFIRRIWRQFTLVELEAEFRDGTGATEAALMQLSSGADGRMELGLALERPRRQDGRIMDDVRFLEQKAEVSVHVSVFESFPMTDTGKVHRAALRERIRSERR